jgi:hypothetical protein
MIIPFTFNGESYYVVRTFKAHQSINRPQESKIALETIQEVLAKHSLNTHGVVTVGKEGKGKELKGRERG